MKTLIIFLTSIFLISCDMQENQKTNKKGRFEIIEEFKFFDYTDHDSGKIVKDRKTGQCYIFYDNFRQSGMTKIDCKKNFQD